MKIIYAIVSSDDGTRVTDVLTENHFSVTRLATTGGFLKKGNATLMIGTEAEKVDQAIQLIKALKKIIDRHMVLKEFTIQAISKGSDDMGKVQ